MLAGVPMISSVTLFLLWSISALSPDRNVWAAWNIQGAMYVAGTRKATVNYGKCVCVCVCKIARNAECWSR